LFTLLGGPLMLPSIACDGADAADAVQRAWAYLLARPIQLLAAALAAAAMGLILVGVVGWIVDASIAAMQAWAGAWSGRAGTVAAGAAVGEGETRLEGTAAPASWLAGMWIQ